MRTEFLKVILFTSGNPVTGKKEMGLDNVNDK